MVSKLILQNYFTALHNSTLATEKITNQQEIISSYIERGQPGGGGRRYPPSTSRSVWNDKNWHKINMCSKAINCSPTNIQHSLLVFLGKQHMPNILECLVFYS